MAHLVKKTNADILFPVHSSLIGEILKNKSLFGNTLDYCSDFSIYQILHNKNSLLSLAESIDLRVPKTYKSIKEAQFPFVGKPSDRSASEGVFYFFSEKDIIKYGPLCTDEYIFQEYINGFGCGYSLYAKEGEIQNAYGHKRIAEHPISGGSSIIRGPFMHKDMQTAVEKILKKTNWTGFAMFEFKMTKEGEIVLIEVNPRIWGSINQGLQNG
ncbi:MAG: ATP-grasp domain-containing protein, partial [Candidatus Moranbacteria bacterium]|nr:ATP-grasp domain-containing protein [Candidatus Moranbacteria bacterium]